MERLKKVVNGKIVDLTPQEESKVLTERQAREEERAIIEQQNNLKKEKMETAIDKLKSSSGLTEEEIDYLFPLYKKIKNP